MKDHVFLEYTFIFDPVDTWQHLHDFERDLADFFAAHGFEANVIKTVDGFVGRRLLYIKKMDVIDLTQQKPTDEAFNGPKKQINDLKTNLKK